MDEMDRLFRQSDFSAENEGLGTRIWNRLIRRKEEPVIMPIHKNEITEEMMMQAMQCKDADELIALAKTGGYEITKEEVTKSQKKKPRPTWRNLRISNWRTSS